MLYCFRNEGRRVYKCKVTLHRLSEVSETVVGEQLVSNTVNVYAAMMHISATGVFFRWLVDSMGERGKGSCVQGVCGTCMCFKLNVTKMILLLL